MKHARRTVITCAGYVGLIGCFLAGDAALASTRNGTIWVRDVRASSVEQALGGTHVRVNTRTSYITADGNIRRYGSPSVLVARPTLRQGALALARRGIMHPGFQLAITAAGFIWSQQDGLMAPRESGGLSDYYKDPFYPDSFDYGLSGPDVIYRVGVNGDWFYGSLLNTAAAYCNQWGTKVKQVWASGNLAHSNYRVSCDPSGLGTIVHIGDYENPSNWPESETVYEPATDEEIEQLDEHIPVEIVQDLYGNNFAIPQWQEAISVMGQPATDVQSNGQLMPEIADAVGKWGKNIADKLNGDEPSYPDAPDHSRDAQEEYYDCQLENCDGGDDGGGTDWDEPIPPFEEPEIKWQTEILTLPDWSSGIGSGSCPGSRSIPMPLGGGSLDIDYQPACDLATMVRPALIGTCGFIALLIVVRARGGA